MEASTLKKILLVATIFVLSFFQASYRIGDEQIKIWDESSSARNGVEMLHSGNYLYANINGKPDYVDVKPPLQLWVKVLSYKLFGINEFGVRFSSLLSFFLLSLLLFGFAYKYLKSWVIGLLLVVFPAITKGFMHWHMAWHGDTDLLLMLFTTMYILYAFLFINSYPDKKLKYLIALSMMVTVAYFTKSIAGIAPAAGIVVYIILKKRKILLDYKSYIPIGIFALVLVVYYSVVEYTAPGYLKSIFNHHFLPFTEYPTTPKHPEFSYYTNLLFNKGFYPFMYWLPIVIVPLIFSKNSFRKNLLQYLLTVSVVFLLGQSSALMKNSWYIGPIYPLLWLILSISIYETYLIIKERLFHKHIAIKYVTYILVLAVVYSFGHNYKKIFQKNEERYSGYIDPQERDGDFIRRVVKWSPYVKEIYALKKKGNNRQMDFYIKKAKYFDNKKITIVSDLKHIKGNSYVACTEKSLQKQINAKYFNKELFKAKYGIFYYIIGEKSKPYDYYKYNPNLLDSITNVLLTERLVINKAKSTNNDIWVTAYNDAKWMINKKEKITQRNELLNGLLFLEKSKAFKAALLQKINHNSKVAFNEQYDAIVADYWGKKFAFNYKSSLNLFREKYLENIIVNTIINDIKNNKTEFELVKNEAKANNVNINKHLYNKAYEMYKTHQ